MLRNYLATALRNIARNRLYAAITIGGLAVSLAAALLIALFVRHELSYETWIPGYETVYRSSQAFKFPGRDADPSDITPAKIGGWLASDFAGVEAVTRLAHPGSMAQPSKAANLRRGAVEGMEPGFFWADPNFFELFPLPVIAGDLAQALRAPDGVVLTRSMARKYFGTDAPLGETLELDRQHLLRVTAVIEDLPSNTHLSVTALGSGLFSASMLTAYDADPRPQWGETYTYLRARDPGVIEAIRAGFPEFIDRHTPAPAGAPAKTSEVFLGALTPLADIHLSPPARRMMKARGDGAALTSMAGVGVLVVAMAAINFLNLMTACAAARAVEIGVRKVVGAERRALMVQFVGESLLYVGVAATCSFIFARMALPAINGFLGREMSLAPTHDLFPAAVLAALAVVLGLGGGAYPAFILSALQPVRTLRKAGTSLPGSARVRTGLVIVQFAALIGLGIATATVYRQFAFVTEDRLRFDTAQVLVIRTTCPEAFKTEVSRIPGVINASCGGALLANTERGTNTSTADGRMFTFLWGIVDENTFGVLGLEPLAGRNFTAAERAAAAANPKGSQLVVINESALRLFEFGTPAEAVGRFIYGADGPQVIGVVTDFSMNTLQRPMEPTVYFLGEPRRPFDFLSVKMSGRETPQTLAAIAELWDRQPGVAGPMDRFFLDRFIQDLYLDLGRQQRAFEALGVIAAAIAALGLFALSAFTSAQRAKEIGIRKTMGATRGDILRLLLWQFAQPVLWATVIAWPAAYFVMRRWLDGFAYRIDLAPWMFVTASALALTIALATVVGHALLVARARPVAALRYE